MIKQADEIIWENRGDCFQFETTQAFPQKMNMLKYHYSITSANARRNNVFLPNGIFLSQSNLNPLFYKNPVYESQPPYLGVVA